MQDFLDFKSSFCPNDGHTLNLIMGALNELKEPIKYALKLWVLWSNQKNAKNTA